MAAFVGDTARVAPPVPPAQAAPAAARAGRGATPAAARRPEDVFATDAANQDRSRNYGVVINKVREHTKYESHLLMRVPPSAFAAIKPPRPVENMALVPFDEEGNPVNAIVCAHNECMREPSDEYWRKDSESSRGHRVCEFTFVSPLSCTTH